MAFDIEFAERVLLDLELIEGLRTKIARASSPQSQRNRPATHIISSPATR